MERVPVLAEGRRLGELTVETEGLYARCRARCPVEKPQVLRLFAVGDRGELRLGVPEPAEGALCLERRVPLRDLAAIGGLLRGELRAGEGSPPEDGGGWQAVRDPERLFRAPYLRRRLRGWEGALTRRQAEGGRQIALPFDSRRPFPLPGLFCFAAVRTINGRQYAVFSFGSGGEPRFL